MAVAGYITNIKYMELNQVKDYPQVTAIMCTYGRFSCVERAVNCFLAQTYPNKRLLIFNTDEESPYIVSPHLKDERIWVINNSHDFLTKKPYDNVGSIRRDALTISFYRNGLVVTWDDDDIYLPHFMEQAVDRMQETGLPSFKPAQSFFYSGNNLRLVKNTMEASVVASMSKVKEYGYRLETGYEGLGWYTKLRDNKELDENDDNCVPAYCFNWNDGDVMKAPHKQSGDINNPDNFENHKKHSTDRVNGRELRIWSKEEMQQCYKPYFDYIKENQINFPLRLLKKYAPFIWG